MAAYEGNPNITDADIRRLEHALGLDQPAPIQYLSWLGAFLTGDWGYSYSSHRPVLTSITERLQNTVYLMGTVYVVTLLIAIPIGIFTAVRQYSWFDHIVTGTTFAFLSTPTFWLGLLLIIVFGLQLKLLPLGGMATLGTDFDILDRMRHLILPVATLSLVGIGRLVRILHPSIPAALTPAYLRTARAEGAGEGALAARDAV